MACAATGVGRTSPGATGLQLCPSWRPGRLRAPANISYEAMQTDPHGALVTLLAAGGQDAAAWGRAVRDDTARQRKVHSDSLRDLLSNFATIERELNATRPCLHAMLVAEGAHSYAAEPAGPHDACWLRECRFWRWSIDAGARAGGQTKLLVHRTHSRARRNAV